MKIWGIMNGSVNLRSPSLMRSRSCYVGRRIWGIFSRKSPKILHWTQKLLHSSSAELVRTHFEKVQVPFRDFFLMVWMMRLPSPGPIKKTSFNKRRLQVQEAGALRQLLSVLAALYNPPPSQCFSSWHNQNVMLLLLLVPLLLIYCLQRHQKPKVICCPRHTSKDPDILIKVWGDRHGLWCLLDFELEA